MAFPPSRNSDHAVLISIEFASNSKRDALFISYLNDYSCVDWDSPSDHLKDVPLEDVFKLVLLLLLVKFVSWPRLELMYIFLIVSIKSSLTNSPGFQFFV